MIAAVSSQGASLVASSHQGALTSTPSINHSLDTTTHTHSVDQIAVQQGSQNSYGGQLPDDVTAFYTTGHDALSIGSHAASMHNPYQSNITDSYQERNEFGNLSSDTTSLCEKDGAFNHTNSANLFTDSVNFLQKKGGPSDPLAMFNLQAQMIETTLNWSLYGQMASKAVSGIQSLFNNQV